MQPFVSDLRHAHSRLRMIRLWLSLIYSANWALCTTIFARPCLVGNPLGRAAQDVVKTLKSHITADEVIHQLTVWQVQSKRLGTMATPYTLPGW